MDGKDVSMNTKEAFKVAIQALALLEGRIATMEESEKKWAEENARLKKEIEERDVEIKRACVEIEEMEKKEIQKKEMEEKVKESLAKGGKIDLNIGISIYSLIHSFIYFFKY